MVQRLGGTSDTKVLTVTSKVRRANRDQRQTSLVKLQCAVTVHVQYVKCSMEELADDFSLGLQNFLKLELLPTRSVLTAPYSDLY